MPVSNHVREARARRRLSQARLAALAGTSRQTVIAVEGGGSVPSVELALRFARALGGSVDELFQLADTAPLRPLVIAGSDDPALSLLAERLRPRLLVSLSSLGSTAGLEAAASGGADVAAIHFDDNVRHARERLGDAALIHFARREQGVLLRRGKRLARIEDLADLRVALRRPGSGTRLLFDRLLPRGAARRVVAEVSTHAEVAATILRGEADAGTATRATALRYGLSFFPLAWERFDLAVPRAMLGDRRIAVLRDALASREHRTAIEALGGYDAREAGEVVP